MSWLVLTRLSEGVDELVGMDQVMSEGVDELWVLTRLCQKVLMS